MRTVANLIHELQKFPEDAMCSAYEGDGIVAIVISKPGYKNGHGVIHCGSSRTEPATELLGEKL